MTTYKRLTVEQRYQIYALNKAGHQKNEIARIIETSASTVTREFQRNMEKRGYRPKQAQIKADRRKQQSAKALKMTPENCLGGEGYIRFDLSPEQASGALGRAWHLPQP